MTFAHCVKISCCDWFNKELHGQCLGRKRVSRTSGDKEDSGKKKERQRKVSETLKKSDLRYRA